MRIQSGHRSGGSEAEPAARPALSRRGFVTALAGGAGAAAVALTGCTDLPFLPSGSADDAVAVSDVEVATIVEGSEGASTASSSDTATVTLRMVGDVLMHTAVYNTGLQSDGSYNFDHLFTHMAEKFQTADISIVNQETILGGTELGLSGDSVFNSPQEVGDAEVAVGVNVAAAATNHAMDAGFEGIQAELEFWRTEHPEVTCLGIADTEEVSEEVHVLEVNGIKVGLLNYTGAGNISRPSDKQWCVRFVDYDAIAADVETARELGADFVVVIPHTGVEYSHAVSSYQETWAGYYLDMGVDVVINCHPHVIQPVELYERDDGHQMVVFHSLGNYVSYMIRKAAMVGGMAEVTFEKTGSACRMAGYAFLPYVTHRASGTDLGVYLLSDYTEDLANANNIRSLSDGSGFSLSYCKELCAEVLGDAYDEESCTLRVEL